MPINVNLYYVHNKQNTRTLTHSVTSQDYVNLETIVKNARNFTTHDKTTKYIEKRNEVT